MRVSINPAYSYASWKPLQPHYQPRLTFGRSQPESIADQLVEVRGASPQFVAQIKTLLMKLPVSIPQALLDARHQIWITDRPRRNRPDCREHLDYNGAFSDYGPKLKRITISEYFFSEKNNRWDKNFGWENGVIHEIGHMLSYIAGEKAAEELSPYRQDPKINTQYWCLRDNGFTEHPDFKAAWEKDYWNLPKEKRLEPLDPKKFSYFVAPDVDSSDCKGARKETIAEGVDVLLRGKASTQNYEDFHRYFLQTLQVIERVLREKYGITHMPIL